MTSGRNKDAEYRRQQKIRKQRRRSPPDLHLANSYETLTVWLSGRDWVSAISWLVVKGEKEAAAYCRRELPVGYSERTMEFGIKFDPNSKALRYITERMGIQDPIIREAVRERKRIDAFEEQQRSRND